MSAAPTDAPLLLGVSQTTGSPSALSTLSNKITLTGSAAAGSTVTVYSGTTALGSATADANGLWTFTPSALSDGSYGFSATATLPGGGTSASSAVSTVMVNAGIASFSPLTDQWSNPISIGGAPYYVENANINGNAPWAITELNDHTLRFTVEPGDLWQDNGSSRSEISGGTLYAATSTVNVSYDLTVQPGVADTGLSWEIVGQVHADDNSSVVASLTADYPIMSLHMTGAGGQGGGDYLAVEAFYLPTGSNTPIEVPGSNANGFLYVTSAPIVRGQAYSIQTQASFQDNANGFLEVWINGVEVVDYHGPIGYGVSNYWKEGVYEGDTPTQSITVDYANTLVTSVPYAPVITSDIVNGNRAMLSGTAQANSTVSVYDGSTLLGSVKATGSGAWSYQSGALAIGGHSLTAKATDSAGNASAVSLVSSATVSAFTGPIVTGVTVSAVSGEALVGKKITFTVAMSAAATVIGSPRLTLNNGGTATYVSGSGTSALTFQYVVGATDANVAGLSITGVSLPTGAAITDSSNNAAILTGIKRTFGTVVDTMPVSAPVINSTVADANGSVTVTGTAAANTVVHVVTNEYTGGESLVLDGTTVVSASGAWTYTTPSLYDGGWFGFSAYDTNSLGDVSSTTSSDGTGVSTKYLPSPVILSNSVVGATVTLSGVIPATYGSTGASGATVLIFDGAQQIGSATTTAGGKWTFTSGQLPNGTHTLTLKSSNASGASAASLPVSVVISQGAPVVVVSSGPVSVAQFLANKTALDAAGPIKIVDTAAAVSSALDALNRDAQVSAITLTGTPTLQLTVAQTLNDTRALNAITNADYVITITDTGANVSANFDALNAIPHLTVILPTGGVQDLVLSSAQMLKDTKALALLDPFVITVKDTAANLNAISTSQIATFVSNGVNQWQATDKDLSLTKAQQQALAAGGISVLQPYAQGTKEIVTYATSGNIASIVYQGVTGQSYTYFTVNYDAIGRSLNATYSNGMTDTWSYNVDGSYSTAFAGVTGQAYTSYTVTYLANGTIASAWYSTGLTKAWTFNSDGSYFVALAGVTGQAYTSDTVNYGADGKAISAVFSNGMRETWKYNADGSYTTAFTGVTGQAYTSYTQSYGADGRTTSASYSNGLTKTWVYKTDGSYTVTFKGVTGQPYTSYTVTHRADGKSVSSVFSNGMRETWSYNAEGSYSTGFTRVPGQAYTSYTVNYAVNGKPTSATYSNGMTESWTYKADGSSSVAWTGVTRASYTSRQFLYDPASKDIGEAYDVNAQTGRFVAKVSGATIASSANGLSFTAGGDTFALTPHSVESITATVFNAETFSYTSGFGASTIDGFTAGGSASDTLLLKLSMFSGLRSANTAAQDVALLLSSHQMAQTGSNVTITDLSGDKIVLNGITTDTLTQYANSAFRFA